MASQLLFLVPLGEYVIGMCMPLGVALIITMLVISIRAPHIAGAGSHLEKVATGRLDSMTAFVFYWLGATVLDIALWVSCDGGSLAEFPEGLSRFPQAAPCGYFCGDNAL